MEHPHVAHCWEGLGPDESGDGESYSCLLEMGHEGPHEWTNDADIQFHFARASDRAS